MRNFDKWEWLTLFKDQFKRCDDLEEIEEIQEELQIIMDRAATEVYEESEF